MERERESVGSVQGGHSLSVCIEREGMRGGVYHREPIEPDTDPSDGSVVVVPGKLLGSGEVTKSHTIAAYSVSSGAREKIEAAGGRCLTYSELMNENPTGSGVVILG